MKSGEIVLRVKGLKAYHSSKKGIVKAVDDVSFEIMRGEALGLLGESGAGKTSVAMSILGLFDDLSRFYASTSADAENKRLWSLRDKVRKEGKTSADLGVDLPGVEGEIWFEGQDLLSMSDKELRKIRGNSITYVPQGSSKSLNPRLPIETQTAEPLQQHKGMMINQEAAKMVLELLDVVDIGDAEIRLDMFPTGLSVGEDQRVLIAAALITGPSLIITDEPTTAVDGAVRHKILSAINAARKELGLSLLMITNDANIVSETCDKVGIMSAGKLMEFGDVFNVYKSPRHPFTRAFFMSNPSMELIRRMKEKGLRLRPIPGSSPSMVDRPSGCLFHPRCEYCTDICKEKEPKYTEVTSGHKVLCHRVNEIPEI